MKKPAEAGKTFASRSSEEVLIVKLAPEPGLNVPETQGLNPVTRPRWRRNGEAPVAGARLVEQFSTRVDGELGKGRPGR